MSLNVEATTGLLSRNLWLCIVIVILYLLFCFFTQRFMAKRAPMDLERPLFWWNAVLAVYATVAFVIAIPDFYHHVTTYSRSYCRNDDWYKVTSLSSPMDLERPLFWWNAVLAVYATVAFVIAIPDFYHHVTTYSRSYCRNDDWYKVTSLSSPMDLERPLFWWNAVLAVYATVAFVIAIPDFYHHVTTYSRSYCRNDDWYKVTSLSSPMDLERPLFWWNAVLAVYATVAFVIAIPDFYHHVTTYSRSYCRNDDWYKVTSLSSPMDLERPLFWWNAVLAVYATVAFVIAIPDFYHHVTTYSRSYCRNDDWYKVTSLSSPMDLERPLFWWNAVLAVYATVAFVIAIPDFYHHVTTYSRSYCRNDDWYKVTSLSSPMDLERPLFWWNAVLAVYATVAFVIAIPDFYHHVTTYSRSYCRNDDWYKVTSLSSPMDLERPLFWWNAVLAVYATVAFVIAIPDFYHHVTTYSRSYCRNDDWYKVTSLSSPMDLERPLFWWNAVLAVYATVAFVIAIPDFYHHVTTYSRSYCRNDDWYKVTSLSSPMDLERPLFWWNAVLAVYATVAFVIAIPDFYHHVTTYSRSYCRNDDWYKVTSVSSPMDLERPLFWWNAVLAVYATVAFVIAIPDFYHHVTTYSRSYCRNDDWKKDGLKGHLGLWGFVFIMSKVVELGDTAFLLFRKRPLIFLHWFHHATVLLYTWFSYAAVTSVMRWGIFTNTGVHSVMYAYFAARCARIPLPAWSGKAVTAIQIAQFALGIFVCTDMAVMLHFGQECEITPELAIAQLAMYLSYFILFVHFAILNYVFKPKKKIH